MSALPSCRVCTCYPPPHRQGAKSLKPHLAPYWPHLAHLRSSTTDRLAVARGAHSAGKEGGTGVRASPAVTQAGDRALTNEDHSPPPHDLLPPIYDTLPTTDTSGGQEPPELGVVMVLKENRCPGAAWHRTIQVRTGHDRAN